MAGGFRNVGKQSSFPLQPHEEDHQINDEQQHDGGFEYHHPAVVLVMLQELVEIIERLEFAIDGPMPFGKVES